MPPSTHRNLCQTLFLAALTQLALLAQPVAAGELRVTLDGEAGVRSDGNYGQVAQTGDEAQSQDQDLARGGLSLNLSWNQLDRWQLALGYSPSYERSLDDSSLSGTAHRLDLALRGDLTRLMSVQVRDRLLSSPNLDLYQPVVAGQPMAAPRRGNQLLHSLDVSLSHVLKRRLSLVGGVDTSQRRFEDPALIDSDTLGGRLGVAYRWTEEHTFEAIASAGAFSYENGRDTDVRTFSLGYDRPLGRDVQLSLEAGAFWVHATNPGRAINPDPTDPTAPTDLAVEESKTGWRGGARISQQLQLFSWNAGYRHDVAPGYGLGRESVVDNGFAGVATTIGRRLTLGLDANASRQREVDETNAATSGRDLEFAAGTGRLSWAMFPRLRLTGSYSRIWQSSKVEPFEDLSYNRYFLGLTFRIFSIGETPRQPEELERREEPTDAETEPDAQ